MPRRRPRLLPSWRLLLLPLAALLSACGDPVGSADGDLQFRVENGSLVPLDQVIVGFPEERVTYGRLSPGERSAYRDISSAYGYAYVEVRVGDLTSVQQPIDYVGESLLPPGRYTYIILPSDLGDPWGVRTTLRRD
jgi:hypothetical protein